MPGPVLGVVHLLPLPGSPGYRGKLDTVLERTVADAQAYARGGAHGLVVENYGDAPFSKGALEPAALAALTRAAAAIRDAVDLPLGINALRNDARGALGVAAAVDAAFIRVNVLAGVVATDQGLIEGDAAGLLRQRTALRLKTAIAADVHVKHGRPLHGEDIGDAAADLVDRAGADAVIVTGPATGRPLDLEELARVRAAIGRRPLFAGSGVTAANVRAILRTADGVIVGTSLKKGGKTRNPVDVKRVQALVRAV